jgi:hypothetical protein
MRVFEPAMSKQVDVFLLQLLNSSQSRIIANMTPRCERLGVDVVGQLAFGYPLNTQSDSEHRVIVDGFKTRSNRSALYFFGAVSESSRRCSIDLRAERAWGVCINRFRP